MLIRMGSQDEPRPGSPLRVPLETARWEAEQWHRIKAIFLEAVELPESERTAFVAMSCAGQSRLRDEINSLLASEEAAESFLETAAAEILDAGPVTDSSPLKRLEPGTRLGEYEIISFLSAGGDGRGVSRPPHASRSAGGNQDRQHEIGRTGRPATPHPRSATCLEPQSSEHLHDIRGR